jgi:hypothetical protein
MLVSVSTLHGLLLHIDVNPTMLVMEFKQCILNDIHWQISPLASNADLAYLMAGCILDDLVGIRVSTYDGVLLQDAATLGSQVKPTIDTLYKVVFMKQFDLTNNENSMLMEFANLAKRTSGLVMHLPSGTLVVVEPVWAGPRRYNHILGILYQHSHTKQHCNMMGQGVHPRLALQYDDDGWHTAIGNGTLE